VQLRPALHPEQEAIAAVAEVVDAAKVAEEAEAADLSWKS
jgi:hypothetical protein